MSTYALIIADLNSSSFGEVVSTHRSEAAAERALHKTTDRGAYIACRRPSGEWERRLDARDRAERPPALAPVERQARSRAARTSAGGKQVAVMLTPAAAAKLTVWQAKGMTAAAAISRLLERSRP